LAATNSTLEAHPGHASRRSTTPTHSSASAELPPIARQGSFVAVNNGDLQLRRADDSLWTVKLSQLSDRELQWVAERLEAIRQINAVHAPPVVDPTVAVEWNAAQHLPVLIAQADRNSTRTGSDKVPEMARAFDAFMKAKAITTRWDSDYLYVESNGIPDHRMMVGITAWQQQVPLPQKYVGANAWRIPLNPVPAKVPLSAKTNFFRGAIALALNGIPIFNPIKNDGRTDTLLAGELDEYGGHCGRADDYHYHIAPVHLEKIVRKGAPIAYALDGYPIYGYDEPDGSAVKNLDLFNGHTDARGNYHYHATKTYPYLNGGFHGEVTERDGQVDPQPRAGGVRPALPPLRGAKITDFIETKPGSFRLTYDIDGRKGTVDYTLAADGSVKFVFGDTAGKSTTETFTPRQRGPGGNDPPSPPGNPPAAKKAAGKKKQSEPPPRNNPSTAKDSSPPQSPRPAAMKLVVTSAAVDAQGRLATEYTCDGASVSPPVEWRNAPAGTKSFAISLWHVAPDQEKSYWLIYNIPANVTKLGKNEQNVGTIGLNGKRRAEYDPMCSKGPGVKTYHLTVFALSAEPELPPEKANREGFLAAIRNILLAEGNLDFQYERAK